MNDSTALIRPAQHLLPSQSEWTTMLSMADAFVKSGLLPDGVKTAQAALLIIQKGQELGIKPTHALSNIAVIKGKPSAGAELLLALIYRDHGDDAARFTESSDTCATLEYKRRSWKEPQSYSFTIEDARKAKLTNNATWQNYPAAMLRARCISAVARMAFPDSIGGMHTPEELGAEVSVTPEGNIEVIEQTPEPVRQIAPPDAVDAEVIPEASSPPVEHDRAALDSLVDTLDGQMAELAKRRNKPLPETEGWIKYQIGFKGHFESADELTLRAALTRVAEEIAKRNPVGAQA